MRVTLRSPTALDEFNAYSHEFTHLLGKSGHLKPGNVNGDSMVNPARITNKDFEVLFGRQIQQRRNEEIRRAKILSRSTVFKWGK